MPSLSFNEGNSRVGTFLLLDITYSRFIDASSSSSCAIAMYDGV